MAQSPMFKAAGFSQSLTGQKTAPMTTRIEANARIRFSVAQALAQGRMTFHYQPVVRAGNTRFPAFFEMLARMRLPDGQMVPASAFLPHVEDGLLGRVIDRLALTSALKKLAAHPTLRLSVNISPHSMGDEEWLAIFAEAARDGNSVCGRLILEITEDAALQDSGQTIEFMDLARRTGCALALDDFGAGATGFRHFREFRFDMVKIDGAFVQGVHSSPDSQILFDCLMSVADHFEMLTVAERVESEADARWLIGRGVDCLQGYLYGRPVPDAELSEFQAGLPDRRAAG